MTGAWNKGPHLQIYVDFTKVRFGPNATTSITFSHECKKGKFFTALSCHLSLKSQQGTEGLESVLTVFEILGHW